VVRHRSCVAVTWLAQESPKKVPGVQAVPEHDRERSFGERRTPCRAHCRDLDCTVAGAVALKVETPGGVSSRCLHAEASRRGRVNSRSTAGATDQRHTLQHSTPDGGGYSRWRVSLCRRSAERQIPKKRRGPGGTFHEERCRTLRRAHHEGGPAATGCQRNTHEERSGCRAGTPVDRQTCPQKRVFKSFP